MAGPTLQAFGIDTEVVSSLKGLAFEAELLGPGILAFNIDTDINASLKGLSLETGVDALGLPQTGITSLTIEITSTVLEGFEQIIPPPPTTNYFYRVTNIGNRSVEIVSGQYRILLKRNQSIILSEDEYIGSNVPSLEGSRVKVVAFEDDINRETLEVTGSPPSFETPKKIDGKITVITRKFYFIKNTSNKQLKVIVDGVDQMLEKNGAITITSEQYGNSNIDGLQRKGLLAVKIVDYAVDRQNR